MLKLFCLFFLLFIFRKKIKDTNLFDLKSPLKRQKKRDSMKKSLSSLSSSPSCNQQKSTKLQMTSSESTPVARSNSPILVRKDKLVTKMKSSASFPCGDSFFESIRPSDAEKKTPKPLRDNSTTADRDCFMSRRESSFGDANASVLSDGSIVYGQKAQNNPLQRSISDGSFMCAQKSPSNLQMMNNKANRMSFPESATISSGSTRRQSSQKDTSSTPVIEFSHMGHFMDDDFDKFADEMEVLNELDSDLYDTGASVNNYSQQEAKKSLSSSSSTSTAFQNKKQPSPKGNINKSNKNLSPFSSRAFETFENTKEPSPKTSLVSKLKRKIVRDTGNESLKFSANSNSLGDEYRREKVSPPMDFDFDESGLNDSFNNIDNDDDDNAMMAAKFDDAGRVLNDSDNELIKGKSQVFENIFIPFKWSNS